MDNKQQKVALYARVSSQEQAIEGVSIEAQVAALTAYAKSQDWEIFEEYIDAGYSGGTDDRPALKRLLLDANRRRFDIVSVCKLDRFFRNLRLLLNHLHGLEKLGIKFVSTQEGMDTATPYGKFAMQIMGVIAEFERGRIGERVKDSRCYLIAQGHWPGGRTVYGYRWLNDEKRWEIDEDEAKLVRYIYDLYLDEKLATVDIPFKLNEEGCYTRLGNRWGFTAVYRILSDPAYKGKHTKGYNMPVIIDEETWEKAQIKRREARRVRKRVRNWLLQGRCICGECGHVLSCQQKNAAERRHYGCPGRWKDTHLDGSPKCQMPRIKADLLENVVWNHLKAVLTDSDILREGMRNSLSQLKERREQLYKGAESLDKKLSAVIAKKERLGLVFADGAITRETYQKKLRELVRIEKDLLKARDNLNPQEKIDLDELESAIMSLEKRLSSKSDKLLLTELGVITVDFPEDWIVGYDAPIGMTGLENYAAIETPDMLNIPEIGLTMKIVDKPDSVCSGWNFEITRDALRGNIREIFNRLGIKVYVFKDRIEIRGYIPTEVIDITLESKESRGGAIIHSAGGLRGRIVIKTIFPLKQTDKYAWNVNRFERGIQGVR